MCFRWPKNVLVVVCLKYSEFIFIYSLNFQRNSAAVMINNVAIPIRCVAAQLLGADVGGRDVVIPSGSVESVLATVVVVAGTVQFSAIEVLRIGTELHQLTKSKHMDI